MATKIKSKCPKCSKLLNSTDETIGETGTCPRCKAEFVIKEFKTYGGIGRLEYFIGGIAIAIFNYILQLAVAVMDVAGLYIIAYILMLALMFFLVINRLKNIGRNGAWAILMVVPVANLFVAIPCLMCPEGYEDTKKLDTAGKIIFGILIGLVAFAVIGMFIALNF